MTDASRQHVKAEVLAEAGVWIARLHGDNRSPAVEDGFRSWLRASAENARAFELATEVWEDSSNLRRVIVPASFTAPKWPKPLAAAAAIAAMAVMIAVFMSTRQESYATAIGEQRLLTLEDGTRVFLNTATRIVVRYDRAVRLVELSRGEALFSVAKRAQWPFVVSAGAREVKALGTSFVVRREEDSLAVTLVEGSVVISPSAAVQAPAAQPNAGASLSATGSSAMAGAVTLQPGQRLTLEAGAPPSLDELSLDQAVAWRRGHVVFEDTSLAAAAREMNRYVEVEIIVEGPAARQLLVNGLFQAGESASFARAVAHTYGLSVRERAGQIVIGGTPSTAQVSGAILPPP
jgi:transmembrane sensor